MKTAYKFRAYPSKKQKEILNRQMSVNQEPYLVFRNDQSKTPLEAHDFSRVEDVTFKHLLCSAICMHLHNLTF
jgi:hypothetical protein